MKWLYFMLILLATFAFSPSQAAVKYEYPLGTRSIFLTGCLLDRPLDFNDSKAVHQKMRTCLCLLDRFQGEYTSERFMKAFAEGDNKNSWRQRNINEFVKKSIPHCL